MKMVIPAIPADNETNRAHAARFGQDWGPWPIAPSGSVSMSCENCHGAVLLDPDTGQLQHDLVDEGHIPLLYCLICVRQLLRIKHIAAPCSADEESLREGPKRLHEDPAYFPLHRPDRGRPGKAHLVNEPVTLSVGCGDVGSALSLRMHREPEPDRLVIEVHVPFEVIEQFAAPATGDPRSAPTGSEFNDFG